MSRPSPRERYETCEHRFACDRMARMANLLVWYSIGEDANESTAEEYRCGMCGEWKKAETA